MDTRTLDQILDEINTTAVTPPSTSAGMQDVNAHEMPKVQAAGTPGSSAYAGNPGGYSPANNSAQRTLLGGQTTFNLNNDAPGVLGDELTDRQRRLPKLDMRIMGGALAVFVLVVGVGSATILSGQEQDVRNFASDGSYAQVQQVAPGATTAPQASPTSEIAMVLAKQMAPYKEQLQDPSTMLLITVLVFTGGFIALGGFLFWLLRQEPEAGV